MYLTPYEQEMLDGKHGYTIQRCMEILVTLGEIYGAEKMIEINNVHFPGVSYRVAGDAGKNYVKDAAKMGGKFKTHITTLNTIGIDSDNWREKGFPEEFSKPQLEMLDAYKKMGALSTYTCTPYLSGNVPNPGQHVSWGESSAICFVNSVLGARTNREGGPSALAAAICGRVPAYGLHLEENRKATHLIDVQVELKSDKDFAVLGYFSGKLVCTDVALFTGFKNRTRPTMENLKALCAAIASSGAVALYHIEGVTPEAPNKEAVLAKEYTSHTFTKQDYDKVLEKFTLKEPAELIVIGCPHCSITEVEHIAGLIDGKKVNVDTWVCMSGTVKSLSDKMGYTTILEEAGVIIILDTCPVLCPTSSKSYNNIMTNSGKLAHYTPGLWNMTGGAGLNELEDCLNAATNGGVIK